ncbi:MAG: class I SAM-dependent methyltransferase [Rickettsiales bacterium]|nr:class I SAM-dependent methyltransferase [Rickettsiales bacterium]
MIQKFVAFKKKAQDLIKTNYELGLFHLYNHNINDCILRLRIVLFFNPNHLFAKYYLAICLYINNKTTKAEELLKDCLKMEHSFKPAQYLLQFFKDLSLPDELDQNLVKDFSNALIDEEVDYTDKIDAYNKLTTIIKNHIADTEKQLNILDAGCGTAHCFQILKQNIKIKKSVGLDFANNPIELVSKQKLYTDTISKDFQLFAVTTKDTFDLIIVEEIFNYHKNFSKQLAYAKKILAKNGLLAFIVDQSHTTIPVTFNHTLTHFCYSKDYILETVKN